jgi:hypothetical protein
MHRTIVTALVALAAVTGSSSWAQQQQKHLSPMLVVRNSSPVQNGAILMNVYAVPAYMQGNWGKDMLGGVIVGPASVVGVLLIPGVCVYDVRLVFDNGFSAERRAVDACSADPMNNVVDINGGLFARGWRSQ